MFATVLALLPAVGFSAAVAATPRHVSRVWHRPALRAHARAAMTSALASTSGGEAAAASASGETAVPSLWTQTSRTYAEGDGTDRLVASVAPLNYKDSSGAWQAIDDSLVADSTSGFAWRNKADAYTAEFPADPSTGPIRVSTGGQWVQFQLQGAASVSGTVSGNTITYANVLPGVTITYAALPTGVKESVSLASAAATASFPFAVSTSSGLSAATSADGGLTYAKGSSAVMALIRPWVEDASGSDVDIYKNVSFTAKASSSESALVTFTINPDWLAASGRQFPVLLDPTLSRSGSQFTDCYIASGSATSNFCNDTTLRAGYDTSNGTRRSLLQFDVSAIPGSATILDADMQMYLSSISGATSLPLEADEVCQAWSAGATWNTYNGTSNWPNSPGDACPGGQSYWVSTVSGTGWFHWHLTSLAQLWVNGGPDDPSVNNGSPMHANNGVIIERHDSTNALAIFNSAQASSNTPQISIYYTATTGGENSATYLPYHLSGRATAGINPATGNLLLDTVGLNVTGLGVGYQLNSDYNSALAAQQLGTSPDTYPNEGLPAGWTTSTGNDVFMRVYGSPAGAMVMRMPDGGWISFTRQSPADWAPSDQTASPGVNATLKVNTPSTGQETVTFHNSGTSYVFTENSSNTVRDSLLTTVKDKHGNSLTINRTSGQVSSITDNQQGRTYTYNYTNGVLSSVAEGGNSLGRSVSWSPNASQQLGTFTDAAGGHYSYSYNTQGLLSDVTTPGGRTIHFDYDATNRISDVIRSTGSGDSCTAGGSDEWLFTYEAPDGGGPNSAVGETELKNAQTGVVTKYYWDAQRHIVRVKDPLGRTRDSSFQPTTGMQTGYADNEGNAYALSYTSGGSQTRNLQSITGTANGTAGISETFAYSSADNGSSPSDQIYPQTAKNSWGNTTTYGQTGNDLTDTTAQDGTHVHVDYNTSGAVNGTIKDVQDPNGNQTNYAYFTSGANTGMPQTITPPGPQSAQSFTYDADSRTHTATDGAGRTATYTYDNLDQVTKVAYGDGTSVSYGYDPDGNLTSRTTTVNGSSQETDISYDGFNRPVQQQDKFSGQTDSFCYDTDSNLTQLTDGGGTVKYGYDTADDVTSVTEPGGSCSGYSYPSALPAAGSRCIVIGWDPVNVRRTGIGFPGQVNESLDYRHNGALKDETVTKGSTSLVNLTFSYTKQDCTGNSSDSQDTPQLTKVTDNLTNVSTTYCYDGQDRLASASDVETDSSGNYNSYVYNYGSRDMTSEQVTPKGGTASTTYFSNDADNELCRISTAGALSGCTFTSGDSRDLSYNGAGDLTATGTAGAGSGQFAATYNAAAQTTNMTDLAGANSTALSYLDTGQNLRYTAGTQQFTNAILGQATSTDSNGTGTRTAYTRDPQGNLLSYRVGNTPTSTTNHYYLLGWNSSVIATTDATGTQDAAYYYDPYGKTLNTCNLSACQNNGNRYGYDSGWLDPTGYYHYGQRYYNPTLHTWSQQDSDPGDINAPKDLNRYSYAGWDPINNADPSGKSILGDVLGGLGAAVGIAGGIALAATGVGGIAAAAALGGVTAGLDTGAAAANGASGAQIATVGIVDAVSGGMGVLGAGLDVAGGLGAAVSGGYAVGGTLTNYFAIGG